MDEELQGLRRDAALSQEAEARLLLEQVRSGVLSREALELAALCGHGPAIEATGEPPAADLLTWVLSLPEQLARHARQKAKEPGGQPETKAYVGFANYLALHDPEDEAMRDALLAKPALGESARRWIEAEGRSLAFGPKEHQPGTGLDARWVLWRVDDHGNRYRMQTYATEEDARSARANYEARGHKQHYWVEHETQG